MYRIEAEDDLLKSTYGDWLRIIIVIIMVIMNRCCFMYALPGERYTSKCISTVMDPTADVYEQIEHSVQMRKNENSNSLSAHLRLFVVRRLLASELLILKQ